MLRSLVGSEMCIRDRLRIVLLKYSLVNFSSVTFTSLNDKRINPETKMNEKANA